MGEITNIWDVIWRVLPVHKETLCRTVLRWRLTRFTFEEADEVLRIAEPQSVTYLCDAEGLAIKQFLGTENNFVGDKILCRFARLHLNQFAEIS